MVVAFVIFGYSQILPLVLTLGGRIDLKVIYKFSSVDGSQNYEPLEKNSLGHGFVFQSEKIGF